MDEFAVVVRDRSRNHRDHDQVAKGGAMSMDEDTHRRGARTTPAPDRQRRGRAAAAAGGAPARAPDQAARGVGRPDPRRAPAGGDDRRRWRPRRRRSTTTTSRCWRPAASRRCSTMPATCRSGSSRAVWRPTRWSASCCCCATSWPGRCSRSTSSDFALLNRVLDAYEPAANRIANTVAVSFVDERERVIRQQQDSIRELSTPVLPVRERLLILPIIGSSTASGPAADRTAAHRDPHPPGQGRRHRHHRCPDVDEAVANHLVQTVDAPG